MTTINAAWQAVVNRVSRAALAAHRSADSITLLAVSKKMPAASVRATYQAGQTAFGENTVQEALAKMSELSDLPLEWHFIGSIQGNKTRQIAESFDWVHSVDRAAVATRLSQARPAHLAPLQVCIQVNISGENSKSGVKSPEVLALAELINTLPGLKLRGLMAIPQPSDDFNQQRVPFARLRNLLEALNRQGLKLDVLSMGMSADLEAAIMEGATIVRVGSAIFGQRV